MKSAQSKRTERLKELLKEACRLKYGNTCYTCGAKNLSGSNWQTGHFLPSGSCGVLLRWDLRNVRPQCCRCNCHMGGEGAEFALRMIKEVGQDEVYRLRATKSLIFRADRVWYEAKILELESIIKFLKEQKSDKTS